MHESEQNVQGWSLRWRNGFGLLHQIDQGDKMDGELSHHCKDGVQVEYIWQRAFGRQFFKGLAEGAQERGKEAGVER